MLFLTTVAATALRMHVSPYRPGMCALFVSHFPSPPCRKCKPCDFLFIPRPSPARPPRRGSAVPPCPPRDSTPEHNIAESCSLLTVCTSQRMGASIHASSHGASIRASAFYRLTLSQQISSSSSSSSSIVPSSPVSSMPGSFTTATCITNIRLRLRAVP